MYLYDKSLYLFLYIINYGPCTILAFGILSTIVKSLYLFLYRHLGVPSSLLSILDNYIGWRYTPNLSRLYYLCDISFI